MDPIITASLIGAGSSLLGGLFGSGSKGGGTQTTTQAPMPWEADAKKFWDEFSSNWYGTPAISGTTENIGIKSPIKSGNIVPVYIATGGHGYTTDKNNAGYSGIMGPSVVGYTDIGDTINNIVPSGKIYKTREEALKATQPTTTQATSATSSYQQRLEQDIGAKQKAGEQFLTATTAAELPYSELLKNIATQPGQYYKPIGFKAGDFQTSWTPNTDMKMVEQLKKTAMEQAALGTGAAGRERAFAEEYTPNKAYMDYMAKLKDIAMTLQTNRYGLPTQASTATGTYTPGWQATLSNAINAGLNVYQGINAGQTASQLPSASTINTSDIWDPSKLFSNVSL